MSDLAQHAADVAVMGELVDELTEIEAAKAHLAAREIRVYDRVMGLVAEQTARVASGDSAKRDLPLRSAAAELATAVRLHDRTVQGRMADAARLASDFPAALGALEEGRISRGHVQVMLETGGAIDDAAARAEFEQRVIGRAEKSTVGRTRAFAQQVAERLNPRTMAERHREARKLRDVWATDRPDGMCLVQSLQPAVEGHAVVDRVTQQAKAIAGVGDPDDARSAGEIRADVFLDLLLTGTPAIDPTIDVLPGGLGAIRALVQVTVPVTTLMGVTDSGAELDGRAPVDPETVRCLAAAAPGWDRLLIDPVAGVVLAVDRYTPSTEQKRLIRARDRHCRFPGCRRPAQRCDIDHTHDHAKGGRTEICNLCCLCTRHHTMKHATDWTVRQLAGGVLEWTSPTGRVHFDVPPPHVVFVPDGDPPPF
jgi:hypothetical protein